MNNKSFYGFIFYVDLSLLVLVTVKTCLVWPRYIPSLRSNT